MRFNHPQVQQLLKILLDQKVAKGIAPDKLIQLVKVLVEANEDVISHIEQIIKP